MGFSSLRLVTPCHYRSAESLARASGADDIVHAAQVYTSLADAIADCHQVYGSSARSRSLEWTTISSRAAAEAICAQQSGTGYSDHRTAMVFGQERSGLSNEELSLCQYRLWIPCNPAFSSLNLGSAVQVVAYELAQAALASGSSAAAVSQYAEEELADAAAMQRFYVHLEETLVRTEFLDPDNPRLLMRRLRRFFGRSKPTGTELNILRGALSSVHRALREAGQGSPQRGFDKPKNS